MSIALLSYLMLVVITVAYVVAVVRIHLRTRDLSIPVGAFLVYFWTLLGAWPFILDAATGYQGYRVGLSYYYLMEKMFPFEVDTDYVKAVLLHGTFMAGMVAAWSFMSRRRTDDDEQRPVMVVDHRRFLIGGVALVLVSLAMVLPEVRMAMRDDVSVYVALSQVEGARGALHGLMNEMAAMCLVLGGAIRLSEDAPRPWFTSRNGKWTLRAYPALVHLLCLYFVFVGDRHPIFVGLVVGCLLLFQVYGRSGWRKAFPLVATCLGAIILAGWVRSFTWHEVATLSKHENPEAAPYPYELPLIAHVPAKKGPVAAVLEHFWTNELFAPHFSMYGVLRCDVPMAPGVSFRYLLYAFRPSFMGARPGTVYDHYAEHARLVPGQGYTIHHATAWYLNAGVAGPFVGGAMVGLLWTLARWRPRQSRWAPRTVVMLRMAPFLFVAFLPQLLRTGPEAYKALMIEGLGMPLFLLFLAGAGIHRINN